MRSENYTPKPEFSKSGGENGRGLDCVEASRQVWQNSGERTENRVPYRPVNDYFPVSWGHSGNSRLAPTPDSARRAGRTRTAANPNPRIARKTPLDALKASEGICPPFPRVPRLPPKFAEFGRISGRSPSRPDIPLPDCGGKCYNSPRPFFPRATRRTAVRIAKLFFIIITAATLAGNASAEATPLHQAAVDNNAAEAKRLIDNGADVNAKTNGGQTPLYGAALANAAEVAKVLIDNGADVNAKDKDGYTPLHWAADNNAAEVAKLLIEFGAAVNVKDKDGWTPLHWAAVNGNGTTAKLLIEFGAAVNPKGNDGITPTELWINFWRTAGTAAGN